MKLLSSSDDISKILESIVRELLERVSKEVLDDFLNDYIEEQVYKVNALPTVYKNPNKQGQFRNIWDFSEVRRLAKSLETEMKGDWTKLTEASDKNPFVHGSYTPSFPADTRDILERLLNVSGRTSHPWSRDSKPYWDNFIKEYVRGGGLSRVVDKHARTLGLTNMGGSVSVVVTE